RIDGHILSGAASTPALSACGTGAAFNGTPSDTAADLTVGTPAPTSCTLTFGTAFVTAPNCTLQAVGAPNQGTISSRSPSAITWTWGTATASQQWTYTCIGTPAG